MSQDGVAKIEEYRPEPTGVYRLVQIHTCRLTMDDRVPVDVRFGQLNLASPRSRGGTASRNIPAVTERAFRGVIQETFLDEIDICLFRFLMDGGAEPPDEPGEFPPRAGIR